LAALAAVSAWFSLGAIAVTGDDARARVFVLAPFWLLIALVVSAIAAAWYLRPRPGRLWPLAIVTVLFLPYLPGPVPAAFLIWDGPIEAFVWLAVVAGMVFDRPPVLPSSVAALLSSPRRAPWIAGALAAVCYAAGAWALADLLPGGDEPHYLVTTQSLLLDGDVRIENNHERGDYRIFTDHTLKPDFIQRGKDGEIYPIHSPGVSVLVLPAFAVAGYPGAVATVIAITASASALAWHAAFLIAETAAGAWFGWAAVFLATPFFFHGFTIYPDGTGGLGTAAGVWLLTAFEKRRPVAWWQLALVGLALSVLPWLHARFALIAGALGVAIVLRSTIKQTAIFIVFPVIVAASWFAYFWVIWGTPNPSAPQGSDLLLNPAQFWTGFTGLLFGQQFGALAHAPVLVMAFAGLALMVKAYPRLAVELAAATLPYAYVVACFAPWWGGVSAPARYLASLMPIAIVPLAWWWREGTSAAMRSVTLLLLLLTIAIIPPKLVVSSGLLIYNDRFGFDLFAEWIAQNVDLAMALPSLHRETVMEAIASGEIWLMALLAAVSAGSLAARRVAGRGAVWSATALVALIAVMVAVSIEWDKEESPGVRPATSQLAMLRSGPPAEVAGKLEVRNVRRVRDPADPVVFRASIIPAGQYALVTEAAARGAVLVEVGRTDQTIGRRQAGDSSPVLSFPVTVHSVTVRAEPGATIRDARLKVVKLHDAVTDGVALRAARYGRTNAFFMDDSSYVEQNGFWTRGEETTTIVFAPDEARDDWTLLLQAGPVPTTVEVSMGDWSQRLEFAPYQQRPVTPPGGDTVRFLKIRTGAWFRPSDRDPRDQDTRRLGVFGIVPD